MRSYYINPSDHKHHYKNPRITVARNVFSYSTVDIPGEKYMRYRRTSGARNSLFTRPLQLGQHGRETVASCIGWDRSLSHTQ